jgi:hypothetical protein
MFYQQFRCKMTQGNLFANFVQNCGKALVCTLKLGLLILNNVLFSSSPSLHIYPPLNEKAHLVALVEHTV